MVDIVNLHFSKVLREVPNKRKVVEASYDKESFVVKFFNKKENN